MSFVSQGEITMGKGAIQLLPAHSPFYCQHMAEINSNIGILVVIKNKILIQELVGEHLEVTYLLTMLKV